MSIARPGEAANGKTVLKKIQKIQRLRQPFADAPELGKKALENALGEIELQNSEPPPPAIESAGMCRRPN
jgi:hypothetical protein